MLEQDAVITLISVTKQPNSYGHLVSTETRRENIFCRVRDAYASDFTAGRQEGLGKQYTFITNPVNYQGEGILEYEGERYAITRPYKRNVDELELHAGVKVGVVDGSDTTG